MFLFFPRILVCFRSFGGKSIWSTRHISLSSQADFPTIDCTLLPPHNTVLTPLTQPHPTTSYPHHTTCQTRPHTHTPHFHFGHTTAHTDLPRPRRVDDSTSTVVKMVSAAHARTSNTCETGKYALGPRRHGGGLRKVDEGGEEFRVREIHLCLFKTGLGRTYLR